MADDRRLVTVEYLEEYAKGLNIPSVDQTFNAESLNAQSGKAVAEAVAPKMDKFADVIIEKDKDGYITKILLDILKNYVDNPIDNGTQPAPVLELINDPYESEPVKLRLSYGAAVLESYYIAELSGNEGNTKVEVGRSLDADTNLLEKYGEQVSPPYPVSQITADILLVRDNNGNPIRILNVADPIRDLDVANKQYVDSVKTKTRTFANSETITITDNTEYIASEEITNLTIIYPDTDFICSFNFTLASTGDITITLPESKYIGSVPSFANGETWELNIKNGVVVGGKVE